jgi:hypothetical protein
MMVSPVASMVAAISLHKLFQVVAVSSVHPEPLAQVANRDRQPILQTDEDLVFEGYPITVRAL